MEIPDAASNTDAGVAKIDAESTGQAIGSITQGGILLDWFLAPFVYRKNLVGSYRRHGTGMFTMP